MSREKLNSNPVSAVVIIVSSILIASLVNNAVSLYGARKRLEQTQAQVKMLEAKKKALESEVATQTDPAALDQAIHNKLNLAQPGETVLVIDGEGIKLSDTAPAAARPAATSPLEKWWLVLNPPKP